MRHAGHLLTLILVLALTNYASAQRMPSGGGMDFGGAMSQLGGSGGGGMNGMGMGMGMNSGFSSGMGMGMSSGFGSGMGSGFGSGMGSGMGMGMNGGFGNSSLGGTGMGGQQAFIGRDSSDMESIFNQLGRNSNRFMQQLNRSMSRGNQGRRNTSQEENMVLPVRVRLDVAFDRPAIQPAMAATKVRGRLEKMLVRRNFGTPGVEVSGDTVILTGVASSESQRMVIEKLVMLEPGVMSVDNRMTLAEQPPVEPTPSSAATPPSPPLPPQN